MITGKLAPTVGHNAKLLGSLFPLIKGVATIRLLSETALPKNDPSLQSSFFGVPVYWAIHSTDTIKRRFIYPIYSSLADRGVCSDAVQVMYAKDNAQKLCKKYSINVVVSTMEPYYAPLVSSRLQRVTRVLYIMDPPISFVRNVATPYRTRNMNLILSKHHFVLTTPFIKQALIDHGFDAYADKIVPVGFPMIERHEFKRAVVDDDRIHLLFCGWLYSDIRSPKYFLDILSRLDERFVVTFMGRECEKLTERFDVQTMAELITLPQQPYETALQAMADADIMINIGNSVPVHMPSKTLEYINTGKPFVNFYKMDDCPTLYYSKRYPLCLNLSEQDPDIDAAAQRFIEFCIDNKGKTVDRAFIESEYADCTPEYIAHKILDALGE